jgi:hypothetical protein
MAFLTDRTPFLYLLLPDSRQYSSQQTKGDASSRRKLYAHIPFSQPVAGPRAHRCGTGSPGQTPASTAATIATPTLNLENE